MFASLMLGARLLVATPSPSTISEHVTCARSTRPVTCDVVRPVTSHSAPLIVLVHGRSGMSFYAERLSGLARRLAESGFVVLIPHYFDATGDPDKPEMTDERFRSWLETVGQVIDFGSRLEGVDPKRVGLSGFSLGAYLSVTRAAEDARVRAVVSSSGGLPEHFPEKVARMPPVLIIHADQDPIASVESMRRLEKRLRENGISVEVLIYPSQDHILEGDAWNDAAGKMVEFFRKTLCPGP
jgi:carboxymethylenebutenolidase